MTTAFPEATAPLVDETVGSIASTHDRVAERSDVGERSDGVYRNLAFGWVAAATVARALVISQLSMSNGEAYYYSWSRFLNWSYYDHPPLVAWLVRLTSVLAGTSPQAVRLTPVLATGVFGLLFYRLAERLFRPQAALFSLILVTAFPVFFGSSFVVNPEAPLAPLWVGFLLAVEGMRTRDGWHRPIVAGALLGFAFLAKYTAILLVPSALLFLAASPSSRRWLRRPSFYAGGGAALFVALPVLIWNSTRGWPTIRLQLVERAGLGVPVAGENRINQMVAVCSTSGSAMLDNALRVVTGQLIAYTPMLALLLVLAIVRMTREARRDDRALFLASFTWPVLGPLLLAMVRFRDSEPHWMMMAVVPATIAVGHYWELAWSRIRLLRGAVVSGLAVCGTLLIGLNVHAHTNLLPSILPAKYYDPRADIINEMVGWDQVRATIARVTATVPGKVVLASSPYAMCGRLIYETGDNPPVYCPTERRTEFDFLDRSAPPADATIVVVSNEIHSELPAGLEDRACTLADQVDVERGGRRVARYLVRTCPPVPREPADSERSASRD
jgi:hypothetical protein